jgi:hypothetical protein
MSVGDLVVYRASGAGSKERWCLIIDVITEMSQYSASGCKRYMILTDTGEQKLCWKNNLGMISESR